MVYLPKKVDSDFTITTWKTNLHMKSIAETNALDCQVYFDRKQTNLCQEDGCAHETPGLQPRHVQEADVHTSQAFY
jgi:hypothetical protein